MDGFFFFVFVFNVIVGSGFVFFWFCLFFVVDLKVKGLLVVGRNDFDLVFDGCVVCGFILIFLVWGIGILCVLLLMFLGFFCLVFMDVIS